MLYSFLDRDIVQWDMFKDEDPLTLKVYLYLLANYNMYDSTVSDGRQIKKYQTVFSYRNVAKALGADVGRVRTAVKRLALTHKLTHESTHLYSIATFDFQGLEKGKGKKFTHESTRKSTPSKETNNNISEPFFGDGVVKTS